MGKVELSIEIAPELAAEAGRLGVDLSLAGLAGVERALAIRRNARKSDAERAREARGWAEENTETLKAYNDRIARDGVFGEDFRTW